MYSTGDDHELYQRKGAWPTSQLLNDLRRCQEVDSPVTRERSHELQPGSNWSDHQLLLATWTSIALLYGETLRKGGIPRSSAPNHPYHRNWATSKTQAATNTARCAEEDRIDHHPKLEQHHGLSVSLSGTDCKPKLVATPPQSFHTASGRELQYLSVLMR